MNKTKQMAAALLAVVVIGAGGFWLYDNNQSSTDDTVVNTETTQVVVENTPEITISEDGTTVSYLGQEGKTALELLQGGTKVIKDSSDFGDFVTGINGLEADSNKEYWSFYVNGEYASEGAGTYQTTDGEKIEWKLEQL